MTEPEDGFSTVIDLTDPERVTIRINGIDFDISSAPFVVEAIGRARELRAEGDVYVDLTRVGFMDSSGLSVIISSSKELHEAGRRLILYNPGENVVQVLRITGTLELIPVKYPPDDLPPAA